MHERPLLSRTGYHSLPGWREDDLAPALAAFRRSARHARSKPYRTAASGLTHADFAAAYGAAEQADASNAASAKAFFEAHFIPFTLKTPTGEDGFVTGFYEPVADASPVKTEIFRFPLLRRPNDLVEINDGNRPAGLDPYLAFARNSGDGLVEYFDRPAIERGALADQGLELAWLADPVDVFFIHVQGAARLHMPDGTMRRVTYAAKSGQRFTGPGGVLADLGEIARAQVTMQSIRAWFKAHPERVEEILHQNRSFIFFRDAPVEEPELGPVAAAKVPLTPGRSLAVDRLIHTFGTPFFIEAPTLTAFDNKPFQRLMIAQDTGSAIVGPARGDLFAGTGDAAGAIAGVIRHPAQFTILVPRPAAERLGW